MQPLAYNKKKHPKLFIGILVFIVLIVCLNFFSKGVRNFFYTVSSPVQKLFWQAGSNTSNFFGALLRISDFSDYESQLSLKNQEILEQDLALNNLSAENQVLRQALELGIERDFKMALAQVIGKDIASDSILLNKGSEDGIAKDMAVINQQKVLFGKISEVYKNFSKVSLITNKDFAVDALVQGKGALGVVKGSGNSGIYFEMISKNAALQDGDLIITSALGGDFPKNLLVGEIQNIKKEDTKPFQSANIKPIFNLNVADSLFVITDFKKK